MLLKISKEIDIDAIKINFDSSELWLLNIAIAIIMFGVALGISILLSNGFLKLSASIELNCFRSGSAKAT